MASVRLCLQPHVDVVAQRGENGCDAIGGEGRELAVDQVGNLRLLQPSDLRNLRLGQAPPFDHRLRRKEELGAQQFLLRIPASNIGEDIAAALFHPTLLHVVLRSRSSRSALRSRSTMRSTSALGVSMPFLLFFWKQWSTYTADLNRTV